MKTEVEQIKGIGRKTADLLLQRFKSWKKIQEAPHEELAGLIGEKKALLIKGKIQEQ
jgi:excinuclease ABC subunit C